jgi:ribose transport system permease protein
MRHIATQAKLVGTDPNGGREAEVRALSIDQGPRAVGRRSSRLQLSRFGALYITVILVIAYSAWVPHTFWTITTGTSLLNEYAISFIATLGILFTLAVGCYDLTVGALLGFTAMFTAWLTTVHHIPTGLAIIIAMICGIAVGAVNGSIVVFIGVDSFIVTLGMSSVLAALVLKLTGGTYIPTVPSSLTRITSPKIGGVPIILLYVIALGLLTWYVLEHTPLGRRMYATGADNDAARLAGIETKSLVFGSFLATAAISSLAGILLVSQFGSAAPDQGPNYLLPVFAAALLGATQVKPGRANVAGALSATILLAIGIKGLQLAGVNLWVTDLFDGAALIIAVAASELSRKSLLLRFRGGDRRSQRPNRDQGEQGPGGEIGSALLVQPATSIAQPH